ncbi:hypothetical protein TNCV_2124481 [Trichonephila clavipes]|uniref:Uncharacterized protein n=1 Tax=Trichonephila clavipes TaxID=2585209 RepID=A0A8X6R7Y2_TRICX|nr:hypothetical protein TNCV_2124481 [Trichonephila clavipes]
MYDPRDYNIFRKWPARSFGLDTPGIINLSKQVVCVKRKAAVAKRLRRSCGKDEAELCSKSTAVYKNCRLSPVNLEGPENNMENFTSNVILSNVICS